MADNEGKAAGLLQEAEKKLKAWSLFSGNQKFEDAADLFTKAGNSYKLAKKNDLAANAYIRSIDCYLKLGSKHEAATAYINAAGCLRKVNPTEAVNCLKKAIEFYTDEGRFAMAAKHMKDTAELFEQEADFERALDAYQQSADLYEGANSSSTANSCLLKVAQLSAQLEKYSRAVELYEQVAAASMDGLTKWSVKDYLFKSALCHFCSGDLVAAKRALDKYSDMDPSFTATREHKLLQEITKAMEEFDIEAFTNAVADFDSVSKLDTWKTTMLLRIKNSIKEEDPSIT